MTESDDRKNEAKQLVEVVYKPTVTKTSINGSRDSVLKPTNGARETACWFLHWAAITGKHFTMTFKLING